MHLRWTAPETRRCSVRFICSCVRQSFQERFVPERSCRRRANLQFNSVSRAAVVSAFEQLLAEGYASGKKGAGTYIAPDLPEPFAAIHGRKKRSISVTKTTASSRERGGFVDVTTQSDERPFNLGRTLVDARTAELWRKLSARSLRSFGRHHLGYGDPHGLLELRSPFATISRPRAQYGANPHRSSSLRARSKPSIS